jgi:glycosyltransferase involved in cell wall biosynthesis
MLVDEKFAAMSDRFAILNPEMHPSTEKPLSVLAVTSEFPWPLNSGGHLRTFHVLRKLSRRFRVRLIAPMAQSERGSAEILEQHGISVFPVLVPARVAWGEAFRVGLAAARREPYVFYRRHERSVVRSAVRKQVGEFRPAVIYLDHLDSLPYSRSAPHLPFVIDLHNVYSKLAERTSEEETSSIRRLYLRREAFLLRRMEERAALTADALCAVSAQEVQYYRSLGANRVLLVPNGVDCAVYGNLAVGRRATPPLLLYVGALSWKPNANSAQFLARVVLPRVREQIPDIRLRIVGRDPLPEIEALRLLPGVEVMGNVPDVIPHLKSASLLAVPLISGGGTRLKILEAFAAGLPVVSTPVGCEGLSVTNGIELLIAEQTVFAEAVLRMLKEPGLSDRLAERARGLVRERYDWNSVGSAACSAVLTAAWRGRERERLRRSREKPVPRPGRQRRSARSAPLLVFADDWGRHPSSCQHLIGHLLDRHDVCWVNTIGMRRPRVDMATVRRGLEKVGGWLHRSSPASPIVPGPRVLNPGMWPWLSSSWDRRLNRFLLTQQLMPVLRKLDELPIVITTLPIVADLMGVLPAKRWVYYCVDDFGQWPGLDHTPLREMEARLVRSADLVIAVSSTLQDRIGQMGRDSQLLTHGVDLDHWSAEQTAETPLRAIAGLERPLIVFWGLVDRRMDAELIRRLAQDLERGTILLVGPEDDPDPSLWNLPRVVKVGPLPYGDLARIAKEASVLVMPYADLPVTRALQPLKLKEYLATGKPAVVRELPSVRSWSDCLDMVSNAEEFSRMTRFRIDQGLPAAQILARKRLREESWPEKARIFENWMLATEARS